MTNKVNNQNNTIQADSANKSGCAANTLIKEINSVDVHVRCQKDRVFDKEQSESVLRDKKRVYSFEWEGAQGEFDTENMQGIGVGHFRLTLSQPWADKCDNLALEKSVVLDVHVGEKPEKITAIYLHSEWWTRPAFVTDFSQIPQKTQVLFLKYPDRYVCLVPNVGETYKAWIMPGGEDSITFELYAAMGGMGSVDEIVFVAAEDKTVYGAITKAFRYLIKLHGISAREDRRLPERFRYLGWCSWDAFYTDISEEKVLEKVAELEEKNVPVRWMIMDDGWLSVDAGGGLSDFRPDKTKFPNGFRGLVDNIKSRGNIKHVGVWHALGGYWGGIAPGSTVEQKEKEHLYYAPSGKVVPSPFKEKGFGFYEDWYSYLKSEGIDFVKVDGQSAVKNYYENGVPLGVAAKGIHKALEGAISCFDGAIINCMGMAMENVLSRSSSAVSRNSDDFAPTWQGRLFSEHLLQNAYNALYHGQIYYCDNDMFWTVQSESAKHALLRAISGGPVYISDRVGETDPKVLSKITYLNGRILMMDRPAYPTEDCVFTDPMKDGVLKMTNIAGYADGKAGGIAAFNITDKTQEYSFSPAQIHDLGADGDYLVYDYYNKTAQLCGSHESAEEELEASGFSWYQILPFNGDSAFLGLTEKYVGFNAVENVYTTENGMTAIVKEQGPTGFITIRTPEKVFCNGRDVTDMLVKEKVCGSLNIYTVNLPIDSGRTIVEVVLK